ncbi:CBS domain-containing protein [Thermopolyspora sp. NPDC052614]|uniref:CBS domain-containing protein n=1 Tax=Thermopolyspora sp. NPDC052614 TaxID=3155682 RepID=UPI0034480359
MTMRVREVMAPVVVAVTADSSFSDIVATLERFRVGAVPVIDADRRVLGVVSEDDLLMRETGGGRRRPWPLPGLRGRAERRKAAGTTAGEIMTSPAITVTPGTPVREAASLMHDHRVKQLPVVDALTGRVLGMVRQSDLLKVFERPASELRAAVRNVIAERVAIDPGALAIHVADGVVTITGTAGSRTRAAELAEAVCSVDGVVALELDVEFADDDTGPGPGRVPPLL